MTQQIDVIDSIQRLARAIRKETNLPVSYSELWHRPEAGSPIDATVTVNGATWSGSSQPIGNGLTLEKMQEQMMMWLVEFRREQETDLDKFWGEEEPDGLSEDLAFAMERSA